MDNLTIQVSPLELSHNSTYPLQVSCLLKKVAISTGHTLEKHQLTAFPDSSLGKSTFPRGPTLTLSKQLQLANTKISLHFMQKRNRTVSCIGSAEIDLASLPAQPITKINCPLANSVYPYSQLTLELKRSEQPSASKPSRRRPEQMSLLRTEGQIKQELFLKRRKDPSIPTAYEISRKNYKQLETSCHQLTEAPRQSPNHRMASRSNKSSYHQRFTLGNSRNRPIGNVSKEESPMPRQKTPEPIRLSPVSRNKHEKSTVSYYLKQKDSGDSGTEQPSRLEVRPYQDSSRYKAKDIRDENDQTLENLEEGNRKRGQSRNRYLDITEKLQSIQQRLIGANEKKCKTEVSGAQHLESTFSQQTPQSQQQQSRKPIHRSQDMINISSVTPSPGNSLLARQAQHKLQSVDQPQSTVKATQKKVMPAQLDRRQQENTFQQVPIQQQPFQRIEPSLRAPEIELRLRRQVMQLQSYNQQLTKQNELLKGSYIDAEATIQKLMRQLSQSVDEKTRLEEKISTLHKVVQEKDKKAAEQQQMLIKMTEEYEFKVEEMVHLQEELETRSTLQKNQSHHNDSQQSIQKKRAIEAEGNLRLRENELRHLRLELENLKGQKKILQQEVEALGRGNHREMVKQKSLAKIEQISSSSLVKQTQRQNQSLRAEVKILQEKVEGLNGVLKSIIQSGQKPAKSKQLGDSRRDNYQKEYKTKLKSLQQRCQALEEQLRAKKSLMAEMINLIWTQGDSSLMESIEKYMDN